MRLLNERLKYYGGLLLVFPIKIIASEFDISESTLKSHMKNILLKLGASDRTHAVTIAMKRGFLDG
jgi:DNA-binding NarL/FixJ family response regulator